MENGEGQRMKEREKENLVIEQSSQVSKLQN